MTHYTCYDGRALGDDMTEEQEAQLERMQMLSDALDRAEAGQATGDDWRIIRSECGIINFGERNGTYSATDQ